MGCALRPLPECRKDKSFLLSDRYTRQATRKFTPAVKRPFMNGRMTAPRNSFTGVPVHSAFKFAGLHPVPKGLVPTYSNSPRACRRNGSFRIVPSKSKIVRGASGVGCPVSRSRASALEKVASSEPWLKFRRTAIVTNRSRLGPSLNCNPVSGSSFASSALLVTWPRVSRRSVFATVLLATT